MAKLITLLVFFASAAPQAKAAVWTQNSWQGAAVSAATTSASTGWTHYESSENVVNITGSGIEIRQAVGRSWNQTNDSSGIDGFNRSGSVFSSATVSGSATAAKLTMVISDTITVKTAALAQARGDMAAVPFPGSGHIFLLGGENSDGTATKEILRYTPATDTLANSFAPLKQFTAEAAGTYHDALNTIFLFGGSSGSVLSHGILSYTPFLNLSIQRGGVLPSSRTMTSAAYHPGKNRIYIFGGLDDTPVLLDQIIEYNPAVETVVVLSTALPTPRYGTVSVYNPNDQKIYIFGGTGSGGDLDQILRYDPVAGTVTVMGAALPSARRKVGGAFDVPTGKIHLFGGLAGTALSDTMIYDPVVDTLTIRTASLPSARSGMSVAFDTSTQRLYGFGASSGTPADFAQIVESLSISSGSYTSSVFDTGNLSDLTTISWVPTSPFASSVGLEIGFLTGDTPIPDGTWTNSGSSLPVTNGGALSSFGDHRYIQYVASFTTVNVATASVLDDITIAYTQTAPSATLVSTVFDGGNFFNVLQAARWQGTFPAGTTAHFQIRTASDNGTGFPATFTPWLGPTSASDFYTDPDGGDAVHPQHRDGFRDRFFQYRTVLYSTNTTATPIVSSVTIQYNTLPSSPTLNSLTALTTTSFEARLTDRSTTEDQFLIRYGPSPGFVVGVTTIATTDKAGVGTQFIGTVDNLTPNQLVFVSARSYLIPPDDLASSSDTATEGTIFTLANPPLNPTVSLLHQTSMTVTWNSNGNAGNTPYEISLSTDDFTTIASTPVVFTDNLTATTTDILNLNLGTTYYLRMRAQNGNAIISSFSATTSTQTFPAPFTGLTATNVGITSVTWSWNTSGPAALYRVFNATTDVVLATAASTSYTGIDLATNTFNGIYVEPFTGFGIGSTSPVVSTFTLAAPPLTLTAGFTSTDTISLTWDANFNPGLTPFQVLMSSDDFTADVSTPVAFADNLTSAATSFSGLSAGTTYYFKVRAKNQANIETAFSNIIATPTLPGQLAAPSVSNLGITSITWTWNNTAGPSVFSFNAYLASGTGLTNDLSRLVSATTQTTLLETNLGPNTRHVIEVAALNESGVSALSPATTVFTLANPPTTSQITAVFLSSITLTWNTNQNSTLFTTYDIRHSTDNAAFVALATFTITGGATTKTLQAANLAGFTTHYFKVRALNNASVATDFDVTVSTFLLGSPPSPATAFSAQSVPGALIKLDWTISPTTTVVRYSLYTDSGTGTIDYSVLFASVTGTTTTFLTGPLSDATTYSFGLRARDQTDLEENNSAVVASAVALTSLSQVSAKIITPSGGMRLAGDRLSVIAGLARGSPSDVGSVLFQFRPKNTATWLSITSADSAHANPATELPYAVRWDVTGLSSGFYELRALATSSVDTPDAGPSILTVFIDPINPDIQETNLGAQSVQKRVRIYNTVPVNLIMSDPARAVLTQIEISSGALSGSETFLRVVTQPAGTPEVPDTLANPGIFRNITLDSGQTVFANGKTATIRFSRLDKDGDNRIDGTAVRADNLAIFVYDTDNAVWRKDFASAASADEEFTISGASPHFSFFGLFSPSSDTLGALRVYPVPFKPNGGNPDEGKAFTASDPTSGIIFDNLTASAQIKIFTINGALVWESPRIQGGLYRWDAKNGDGNDAASGVYFAVITSDGEEAVVKKIAIIR